MQYQQRMEEYFSLNHTYGGTGGECAPILPKNDASSNGYYTLGCVLQSGYMLTATATGTQASDDAECTVMYLFRNGTRGGGKDLTSGAENACW